LGHLTGGQHPVSGERNPASLCQLSPDPTWDKVLVELDMSWVEMGGDCCELE
jgi:hypothetical protein